MKKKTAELDLDQIFGVAIGTAAKLFAPDSLVIDADELEHLSPNELKSIKKARSLLKTGDIIVMTTPGVFYSFWRNVTNNQHDHIAVVIDEENVLHIGIPNARTIPIERLLLPKRQPAVYRPLCSEKERNAFVASLKKLIGCRYDLVRAYQLIVRLALEHLCKSRPLKALDFKVSSSDTWICTDAVMYNLAFHWPAFRTSLVRSSTKLDLVRHGSSSLKDIPTLWKLNPDLIERIHLPTSHFRTSPPTTFSFPPFHEFLIDMLYKVQKFQVPSKIQTQKLLQQTPKYKLLLYTIVFLALVKRSAIVVSFCLRLAAFYMGKSILATLIHNIRAWKSLRLESKL